MYTTGSHLRDIKRFIARVNSFFYIGCEVVLSLRSCDHRAKKIYYLFGNPTFNKGLEF